MDPLGAMRTFVEIVDQGSLTAAAGRLRVSLPVVVRTLAALEHRLGVRLLNRTTRRIHLTEVGPSFISAASALPPMSRRPNRQYPPSNVRRRERSRSMRRCCLGACMSRP